MTDDTPPPPKKPLPPTLQAAVAAVKKAHAPAPREDTARGPGEQACNKCGAVFRWVRSDAGGGRTALVARLVQGSTKCDCGYGKATTAGRRSPRT
ncbi:hypothetical protein [Caenispirillum bisanense]|uniref:hypothetical protein n=1 Tax=Caenispirillum bisanense TaxID=414052 RepID=UPI0031D9BA54